MVHVQHSPESRDCTGHNIMQDVQELFPGKRMHPQKPGYSEDLQTEFERDYDARPRFYFIDFGVTVRFEGPEPHLVTGIVCRDQTAPELSLTIPFDPFKLDVYLLGNHFLTEFLAVCLPCHCPHNEPKLTVV